MERFETFRQRLVTAYLDGRTDEALLMADDGASRYPEQARTIRWYRMCILGLAGRKQECMALFRKALDDGDWWSAQMLRRERDFGGLQGDPDFEAIVAECEERRAAAETGADLLIAEPRTIDGSLPLLVALHGSGPSARATLEPWRPATEDGWLVAAPVSSQLAAPGAPSWWAYERARDEIAGHVADLGAKYELDGRIVAAGFSRGGAIAAEAAIRGDLDARGLVAIGPGTFDLDAVQKRIEKARDRGLKAFIHVGDKDSYCLGPSNDLAAALAVGGVPCELEVRPGLGHEFPPAFDRVLRRALKLVSS